MHLCVYPSRASNGTSVCHFKPQENDCLCAWSFVYWHRWDCRGMSLRVLAVSSLLKLQWKLIVYYCPGSLRTNWHGTEEYSIVGDKGFSKTCQLTPFSVVRSLLLRCKFHSCVVSDFHQRSIGHLVWLHRRCGDTFKHTGNPEAVKRVPSLPCKVTNSSSSWAKYVIIF